MPGRDDGPGVRRHEHEVAAPGLDHPAQRPAAAQQRPDEVGGRLSLELTGAAVDERAGTGDARVVDQRVDGTERSLGIVEEALDGCCVGDVERVGRGLPACCLDETSGLAARVDAPPAERDPPVLRAEHDRNGPSDPRRRPHHRDDALCPPVHASPSRTEHGSLTHERSDVLMGATLRRVRPPRRATT